MTQSYSQIVKKIESLQKRADEARKKEVDGVVGRIKEAIAFYKLTAAELGLGNAVLKSGGPAARPGKTVKSKSGSAARYRDESGNEWVGRGPRPAWLRTALAAGKSLADFAIDGVAGTPGTAAPKRAAKTRRRAAKKASVAKYRHESGKTWTGRGRKPAWFISALAEGKTPESMAV